MALDWNDVVTLFSTAVAFIALLFSWWRLKLQKDLHQRTVEGTRYKEVDWYGWHILQQLSNAPAGLPWQTHSTTVIHRDRFPDNPPHPDDRDDRSQSLLRSAVNNLNRAGCIRETPVNGGYWYLHMEASGYEALEYKRTHRWWMIWHRPPF